MTFTIQIDDTNPRNWKDVEAEDVFSAIAKTIEPMIAEGLSPKKAYVAEGERYPSGAPMMSKSYSLEVTHPPQPV